MQRPLLPISAMLLVAVVAACASPPAPNTVNANLVVSIAARPNDYGNIRWNKIRLHLVYPAKAAKDAVLTYWARNGYTILPIMCDNGSTIETGNGKARGNPNRYDRVTFWFRATSKIVDRCSFAAALANSDSPPIAILTIYVNS